MRNRNTVLKKVDTLSLAEEELSELKAFIEREPMSAEEMNPYL